MKEFFSRNTKSLFWSAWNCVVWAREVFRLSLPPPPPPAQCNRKFKLENQNKLVDIWTKWISQGFWMEFIWGEFFWTSSEHSLKRVSHPSIRMKIKKVINDIPKSLVVFNIELLYKQYLNCKILHGDTLLQPWPNFRENYVIPSQQLNDDQKKRSSPKIEVFFPQNHVKTNKKRVFTSIWDYLRPEFVGFIRAGWLLIVSSSSAQISMSRRLNLDGGTPNLDGGC